MTNGGLVDLDALSRKPMPGEPEDGGLPSFAGFERSDAGVVRER